MADRFVQEVAQAAKTWDELRERDNRAHDPSVLRAGIERIRYEAGNWGCKSVYDRIEDIGRLCTKLLTGEEIE